MQSWFLCDPSVRAVVRAVAEREQHVDGPWRLLCQLRFGRGPHEAYLSVLDTSSTTHFDQRLGHILISVGAPGCRKTHGFHGPAQHMMQTLDAQNNTWHRNIEQILKKYSNYFQDFFSIFFFEKSKKY